MYSYYSDIYSSLHNGSSFLINGLWGVEVEIQQTALLREEDGAAQSQTADDQRPIVSGLPLGMQLEEISFGLGHIIHGGCLTVAVAMVAPFWHWN